MIHDDVYDAIAEAAFYNLITPSDFTDDGIAWKVTPLGYAYFNEAHTVDSVLTFLVVGKAFKEGMLR